MHLSQKIAVAITGLWLLSACGSTHSSGRPSPIPSPSTSPAYGDGPRPAPRAQFPLGQGVVKHYESVITDGIAPLPTPMPHVPLGRQEVKHYESLGEDVGGCEHAQLQAVIDGNVYITCSEGPPRWTTRIVAFTRRGRVLATARVPMYAVTRLEAAGTGAVAVTGYNDGAAMRNELSILQATTLRPIVHHRMTDSTFLGVINDRAYIDDYCCFGRGGKYQPATIYSISLKNGSESQPVELAPDPELHSGYPPVGQGAWNYLIGQYFYVVVSPITYRYDVLDLQKPPKRMATPTTAEP